MTKIQKTVRMVVLGALAVCLVAGIGWRVWHNMDAQAQKKIETNVVEGYQRIEDGVVNGYQAVEDGVVNGYQAVEEKIVAPFVTEDVAP